jgi:hypothetical protein
MKNKNTLRNEIDKLKATVKNELNPNETNKNHLIFDKELQKQILLEEGESLEYDMPEYDDITPFGFSKKHQLQILEEGGYGKDDTNSCNEYKEG